MKIVKTTTTPQALPISLSALKEHCRIEDSETVYDADLVRLTRTATEWIEDNCHIVLIDTDYSCYFDSFPDDGPIRLPVLPVSEITDIEYYDANGTVQVLASFQADLFDIPVKVFPAIGQAFPSTQTDRINALEIRLVAGYGPSEASVPETVKQLICLLVYHWHLNRSAVVTGTISKEIEMAAEELTKMVRRNEFETFQ
jgi:uncharacterized phiE125 gp8 family phage protein